MDGAVVVELVRTPVGRRHGSLSGWHPADLAGLVLAGVLERADLDPDRVDEVLLGCAAQVGAQGFNVARNAVLAAGLPESVPAATVDRQDASGHAAIALGAASVASGQRDLVLAGGVEVASLVPVGATFGLGVGSPFGPGVQARYADAGGLVPQGHSAELVAERWGLTREQLDAHAGAVHERARTARAEGRGAAEVLPVPARRRDSETGQVGRTGAPVHDDEAIDGLPTPDQLAAWAPAVRPDGVVTAGNSAPVADGAGAVLLARSEVAARLGLTPRARVRASVAVGSDPRLALTGAVPATAAVLARAGLQLADVDVVEVHEPFASVGLAWSAEVDVDPERVNPNGSALALGHPVGATGARMVASVVAELERTGGRWGLVATAAAGGIGEATVIERLG